MGREHMSEGKPPELELSLVLPEEQQQGEDNKKHLKETKNKKKTREKINKTCCTITQTSPDCCKCQQLVSCHCSCSQFGLFKKHSSRHSVTSPLSCKKIHLCRIKGGTTMGCGFTTQAATLSPINSDEEEFLPTPPTAKHQQNNKTSSRRDESYDDRRYAMLQVEQDEEVIRRLESRWMRSHFFDSSTKKSSMWMQSQCRTKLSNMTTSPDMTSSSADVAPVTPYSTTEKLGQLQILHFNDVYDIEARSTDPVGGAARFASLLKQRVADIEEKSGEKPLIIFSGDCLNPSMMSCATLGRHMIEVFNLLEVEVAVYGNHEFDFGVKHAIDCIAEMKSPWLLGNVVDKLTGRLLADGKRKIMITRDNGLKVGLIGLVEEEWLETLTTVDRKDLIYTDYVEKGKELAQELRSDGAHIVIALTHMRWPNDMRLAREVAEIDLILGGHDHDYGVKEESECLVLKSGTDFRNFSEVDILFRCDGCLDVSLTRHDIISSIQCDPIMLKLVDRYAGALKASLNKSIGTVMSQLDGRFHVVRTMETALGNFVTDIMAAVTQADAVLINSGTFRSDNIHRDGDFHLRDLLNILPINDTVVVIEVTGRQLLDALENGVSKIPHHEGRFPQVSRLSFGFDPDAESGHRVMRQTVRIQGKNIDLDRRYKLATKAYVARGRDGYNILRDCKVLTDPDSGPVLSTVVRNHIRNVKKLLDFEEKYTCQVMVSPDGKYLSSTSNKSPYEAFQSTDADDIEDPLNIVQREMSEMIQPNSAGDNCDENKSSTDQSGSGSSGNQSHHIASFIPPQNFELLCENDDVTSELRYRALTHDRHNDLYRKERASTPHCLQWQIRPMLEARVFRCRPQS